MDSGRKSRYGFGTPAFELGNPVRSNSALAVTYNSDDLTFIVPVRNDAAGLRRCLTSIRAQAASIRILVADNGSTDDSAEVAGEFGAPVLDLPALSVSALRNRAAAESNTSLLAFIDADMELATGWLDAALSAISSPRTAAVGADYSTPPSPTWVQRVYDGMREHRIDTGDARWLASGNMVVRRTDFEAIGGFNEHLTTCEDWDLCMRFKRAGHRVLAVPAMKSVHFGDPATLRHLFIGELWRGRDNLRVSLDTLTSWRDVPSIVIPVLWLLTLILAALGVALAVSVSPRLLFAALVALAGLLTLSTLRGVVIWQRARVRHGASFGAAWIIAVVYDAARALALVFSAKHRRAQATRVAEGVR